MKDVTLQTLRHYAARRSLIPSATIVEAVRGLGFVQADPIRAPARAQDLILRHRVADYRAGELELRYPELPLSEEALHVYGFLPNEHQSLLHPRTLSPHWQRFVDAHPTIKASVLRVMREFGCAHPRDVDRAVGSNVVVNIWGGKSSATTLMLEALHLLGRLRVARRESGQRVYAVVPPRARALAPAVRAHGLARLLATLYAPMPERSLRQALGMLQAPASSHPRAGLDGLIAAGELRRAHIAGHAWIWPEGESVDAPADEKVRLLAPFDPVVWDRRRFALLWDWEYRFEAYTPVAKRKLGYYALPLLWRERVIGWANVSTPETGLAVELGFVGARPRDAAFRRALAEEVERLRHFLGLAV